MCGTLSCSFPLTQLDVSSAAFELRPGSTATDFRSAVSHYSQLSVDCARNRCASLKRGGERVTSVCGFNAKLMKNNSWRDLNQLPSSGLGQQDPTEQMAGRTSAGVYLHGCRLLRVNVRLYSTLTGAN